jgi:hypothetical protein
LPRSACTSSTPRLIMPPSSMAVHLLISNKCYRLERSNKRVHSNSDTRSVLATATGWITTAKKGCKSLGIGAMRTRIYLPSYGSHIHRASRHCFISSWTTSSDARAFHWPHWRQRPPSPHLAFSSACCFLAILV